MATKRDYAGMSDLEREIELEMDDELELDEETDEELKADDEREGDEALEVDEEADIDEEAGDDTEFEIEADERVRDQEYVERFLEIAGRQYESESEVDQALNETLDGMAQEYFFGRFRGLGKWASKLTKNRVLRAAAKLAKKGVSVASGQFPALKAALSLVKGDIQGTIANLGKQALSAAIPGGGAALGALSSLGFTQSDNPEENREAWENYAQLSREAFEHLADNVTPNADQPLEASRLATNAYQHALKRAQARAAAPALRRGLVAGRPGARLPIRARGKVVRLTVRPGQTYVLRNVRKVIVRG